MPLIFDLFNVCMQILVHFKSNLVSGAGREGGRVAVCGVKHVNRDSIKINIQFIIECNDENCFVIQFFLRSSFNSVRLKAFVFLIRLYLF